MPEADKRRYYADPAVVAGYDALRYGRGGGRVVAAAETAAVRSAVAALPPGPVLDLACGTGRLARDLGLAWLGRVVLCDWSPGMLRSLPAACLRVRADAGRLPFRRGAFSGVVNVRFLFHYEDWAGFACEAARILRDGGAWIFDQVAWSPKGLLPRGCGLAGGRIYPHDPADVEGVCAGAGFAGVDSLAHLYAAPGWLYSRMPRALAALLLRLETRWPSRWKSRHYYRARRSGPAGSAAGGRGRS